MKKNEQKQQQPQQPAVAPAAQPEQQPQQPTFEEQMKGLQVTQKQQTALTTLLAEVSKRDDGATVSSPKLVDRKLVVMVNDARVAIGPGGGYEALDVRTYPKATVTFMASADKAFAAQRAKDAAKAAALVAGVEQKAEENKEAATVVAAAQTVAAA